MLFKGSLVGASVVLAGLGVLAALDACGDTKLAGEGGECFVADDCQSGLVCIQQQNKSSTCTSDLKRAAGTSPPDGAAPADAGDEGGEGGTVVDEGGTIEPKDSGNNQPDTFVPPPPPPKDSGSPADTGTDAH